jgi:bacterioferritin (cytochrome b1)
MNDISRIDSREDALRLLAVALKHEWAVSLEYLIHAYSMPKGRFFYDDPVVRARLDMRGQTIQIGIDEMYHALQMGLVIRQLGGEPTFDADEVIRHPRIADNLERDRRTEDAVTALYQNPKYKEGLYPEIENMFWNIAADEVRHSRQFRAMADTLRNSPGADALCFRADPKAEEREEVALLHDITRAENELMHRYLAYVLLFREHQDLGARLFKNSVDHMRHWDKNSGTLIKLGSLIRIENAELLPDGSERSLKSMPGSYPGRGRIPALETLVPAEEALAASYERLIGLVPAGEVKDQLNVHLLQNREHLFTQEALLRNARKIKGLS